MRSKTNLPWSSTLGNTSCCISLLGTRGSEISVHKEIHLTFIYQILFPRTPLSPPVTPCLILWTHLERALDLARMGSWDLLVLCVTSVTQLVLQAALSPSPEMYLSACLKLLVISHGKCVRKQCRKEKNRYPWDCRKGPGPEGSNETESWQQKKVSRNEQGNYTYTKSKNCNITVR